MATNDDGSRYVTLDQIVRELGSHPQTVRAYFRSGALPGRKLAGGTWTTTRAALDQFVEGLDAATTPDAPDSPGPLGGPDGLGPLETT